MMEIIYSDQDIIVVNKPPGIAIHPVSDKSPKATAAVPEARRISNGVHSGGSVFARTLADELLEQFPEIAGVGEDPARPGIVHRLDRDTSGVMVVARRQESFAGLKELFQKRLVEKTYLAIVCGVPRELKGVIDMPIGRLASDPTKRGFLPQTKFRSDSDLNLVWGNVRRRIRGAREAYTEYRVLKTGGSADRRMALVELKPKTGRMHQLRVHMKAIGHPVACDVKYGGKNVCCPTWKRGFQVETPFPTSEIAGDHLLPAKPSRQLLHAQSLSFSYPPGRRNSFEAEAPPDFALAAASLF